MSGDWLTLTSYFGERDRVESGLLGDALVRLYGSHRIHASVVARGAAGFGRLHHRRTDRLLSLSEDLPVVSIAVDRRDRIERLAEPVREIQRRGMITLAPVDEASAAAVADQSSDTGTVKLTVYLGRHERAAGRPAFAVVCELLRNRGIAGATTLLGVDGTLHGERLRAKFFATNRAVPMVVIAVGSGERIARVLPELGGLLAEPLITVAPVQVCKRDGQLLAPPLGLADHDERGVARWQQLTVYAAQSAMWEGRPLSQEIALRLRAADAAGATSLRGIWGFHGDHAPHGDRFLQLRRHVPLVTTSVDTPERTARAFAIVDELTAQQGLVTVETVPSMTAGRDLR